ncbi:hypothetical protein BC830DRAFT_1234252 [Chytriomyces sp. MP71]|nr:hypothetical protein BC830DRAFT_1234252 [Chytriomyces sp. MP71]
MSTSTFATLRARELGASAASGIMAWYGKLPLGAGLVVATATALQFINTFVTVPGCFAGAGFWAAPFSAIYNIFMSHLLHTGWIHLIFNILAFTPFAGYQERQMGTYPFLHFLLLLAFTTSIVYFTLVFVVGFVFSSVWQACVAGLSGIVFALIAVEANKGVMAEQDFFGFKVPGALFPWFLLVITQILFMSASFFGHLAGILAGLLFARGYLDIFIPSRSSFSRVEENPFLGGLARFPAYVQVPGVKSLLRAFVVTYPSAR